MVGHFKSPSFNQVEKSDRNSIRGMPLRARWPVWESGTILSTLSLILAFFVAERCENPSSLFLAVRQGVATVLRKPLRMRCLKIWSFRRSSFYV